jgi:glucokinase
MKQYIFGIDIGGTTIKLGLFKNDGRLLEKWEIKTKKEYNGKYIIQDIVSTLEEKFRDRNIIKEDIIGIGIGVPGPVLEDGTVLKCVNIGWGIFNVVDEFQKLIDLPIKVSNDANVAALGEMWQGGGKGYENVIMITLGTGVGGGIIVNGKVIPGSHGAGGEIGHIKVSNNETKTCGCGNKGCLEQYASATGMVNTAKGVLNNTNTPSKLRDVQNLSAKDIFDVAKNEDELAKKIVNDLGEKLGAALSYISCVVDPEVFVFGGGVSKAGDILIKTVQEHFKKNSFHACTDTKFELAKLGNDAGIYGAAKLIL